MNVDPGNLIAQQAAAAVRALQLDADRKLAEPLIEEWRSLTEQQRAARSAQAAAERVRLDREARERAAKARADAVTRHVHVFDAATDVTLRQVVALHAPHADAHNLCRGCTDEDADEYDEPEWPCRTFLLIEGALS